MFDQKGHNSPFSFLLANDCQAIINQRIRDYPTKWTTQTIAEMLYENTLKLTHALFGFTDLMAWVMALDGFSDEPEHCGEKILEAIQLAWIDEAD